MSPLWSVSYILKMSSIKPSSGFWKMEEIWAWSWNNSFFCERERQVSRGDPTFSRKGKASRVNWENCFVNRSHVDVVNGSHLEKHHSESRSILGPAAPPQSAMKCLRETLGELPVGPLKPPSSAHLRSAEGQEWGREW